MSALVWTQHPTVENLHIAKSKTGQPWSARLLDGKWRIARTSDDDWREETFDHLNIAMQACQEIENGGLFK